ncbi:MAG: hypothetical protein WDO69_08435 [Pseudomonadota bacterium]
MLLPRGVPTLLGLAQAVLARAAAAIRLANRDPFVLVAWLCALLAVRAMLHQAPAPLSSFDEALLFLNAQLMRDGQVIYRDFYCIYPPGLFQLIRALTALGLPEIWTMRALTCLVHIASAVLSGRIVARTRNAFSGSNPRAICWTTTACVLALQTGIGCIPYAYWYAILWLQVILLAWPKPSDPRWRFWLCGGLIGVLSYVRHDVAVYAIGALGVVEALGWAARRRSSYFGSMKEALQLLGSAAATVFVLWGPVFARAGFSRVLHDLVIDVSRYALPARVLPMPPLNTEIHVAPLNMTLPVFMGGGTEFCVVLSALALLSGVLFAGRVLLVKTPLNRERRLVLLVVPCALATVPQALGRSDYAHLAFVLPMTLAAGGWLWNFGWARFFALFFAVLPWFSAYPTFLDWAGLKHFWNNSENSAFMTADEALVADYLRRHTAPGEPIYVGCASHERLSFAPLSPYYWGHRPGATRYMQLDPGLATTTEGQAAMVHDLERTRPALLLRITGCWWAEPNTSALPGATLLDEYLAAHYAPTESVSFYAVWTRKPR